MNVDDILLSSPIDTGEALGVGVEVEIVRVGGVPLSKTDTALAALHHEGGRRRYRNDCLDGRRVEESGSRPWRPRIWVIPRVTAVG